MPKRLAVIDGKSVFYRGYYAMPQLSTADGTPTGGVFGFASLAIELIKKLEPDYVAVAWDKPKTNIRKRLEIHPEYKAGRKPAPADFYEQIPILHELLEAFGWPLYEIDDYEADDIMGAFARQAEAKGIETCLLTSDLDALQLVSPLTSVYAMKSGLANIELYDPQKFEDKYQLEVEQFLDLKAIMGDSSDNIPGVPGIGVKGAVKLLQSYQTLDGIYQHIDEITGSTQKKLIEGKESAYMSRKVAEIWTDIPVQLDWEQADVNDCDFEAVAKILQRLEFTSLVRRLPENMRATETDNPLYFQAESSSLKVQPWPGSVLFDGPAYIEVVDDELWLAANSSQLWHKRIDQIDETFWQTLSMAEVVGYDIKQTYHQLAAAGRLVRFDQVHDIRQAAFLLEPLRRDRSLEGLVGGQVTSQTTKFEAMQQVYQWQVEAFEGLPKVAQIAHQFDFPLIYQLFKMEHSGIILDTKLLEDMSSQVSDQYDKLEQSIYDMVGREFNIASPAQLSEVLFTDLELPTAGIRRGKTGYSTGQKELDKLRGEHPIIELIESTRALAKLKNTYIDALPKLVDDQSRLHTTFNQDVASTGRLSSTNPNLQNIPVRSEIGKKIRYAFTAAPGNLFVNADYSQFELRLAAVLAGDKELIADFQSGVDIHTKTASDVYGVALEDVSPDQRRDAKVINFGVLYGMGPHALAENTGMSFGQAKQFIDHYFEVRKPIRQFIDATLAKADSEGYVETYYGRRRPTPDVKSSNYMVREAGKRAAANMPIQGTEADLMKRAMIKLDQVLDSSSRQILQIHDSILVECPADKAEAVAKILKETMENIAPELEINLNVDVKIGQNWGEI